MPTPSLPSRLRLPTIALLPALLAGCNAVVMKPHGDVAAQQAHLIVQSTFLMLLIIVPVIALTLWFAFRYRASNPGADYSPDWDHSTRLELVIWGAPLLVIIALGAITWISTHKLDPYRPLDRIDVRHAVAPGTRPLRVEVVALDWKWLFVYPDLGIASVNEMAAPTDQPIEFTLTSSDVMNSFYVPALAGQIYAMPGMQTTLHAVINQAGDYEGFSANYSGAGFSDMRFRFRGMETADFGRWVAANRASGQSLTREAYLRLEQPSQKVAVQHYAQVDAGLFDAVVNRCVDRRSMCLRDVMQIDAHGGAGKGGVVGVGQRPWGDAQRTVVAAQCTPANPSGLAAVPTAGPARAAD